MADGLNLRSSSPEATEQLASRIAERLRAGSVLALSGDLGAGKTCFVRGLARGLGIEGPVASPTYLLMQAHEGGRLPLYHFDAWMEGREKALLADGGAEWLHGDGISVVEWAGRVEEWLPLPRLEVQLTHLGPDTRGIRLATRAPDGPEGSVLDLGGVLEDLELPAGVEPA